jgi:agmatine deiminase
MGASEASGGDPPGLLGARWPAEWEPHRATWLSWPHNRETWADCLEAVEEAFCEIVRALLPGERVEINVLDAGMEAHVRSRLTGAGVGDLDGVRCHHVPTDDAWIRDHGGVFVLGPRGGADPLRLIDFEFDAWGGKYPPWDRDAAVASAMAAAAGVPCYEAGFVLEGGAIEGDGEGTLLTTESCLLNPNRRRPGRERSRENIERWLTELLGAQRTLWLAEGIVGDDTDGHIDDLTRFVAPARVLTVVEQDRQDVDYPALAENRRRLEAMRDARGRRLEVVALPTPGAIEGPEGRLPASYANFYWANAGVLLPVFGVDQDREAIRILEACVCDRPVIPIPARALVRGLGAVHCLTQQEPAVPSS